MARLVRSEVFGPNEVVVGHLYNRTCRGEIWSHPLFRTAMKLRDLAICRVMTRFRVIF